jgi:hypothetical protein
MKKRLFAVASLVWPLMAHAAFARDLQAAGAARSHGAAGVTSGHGHGGVSKPAASKRPASKTAGKVVHGHAAADKKVTTSKGHERHHGGTPPH